MTSSPDRPQRRRRAIDTGEADSRRRILDAAAEEFGLHGYAGARTSEIARRAHANVQLISYYFGGKSGLMAQLRRQWLGVEQALDQSTKSYADSFRAYLNASLDRPGWARLAIWNSLDDLTSEADEDRKVQQSSERDRLAKAVNRIRQRQVDGEISGRQDPEFILLVSSLLTFAPLAMPDTVKGAVGLDPFSAEYRDWCVDQVQILLASAPADLTDRSATKRRRNNGK